MTTICLFDPTREDSMSIITKEGEAIDFDANDPANLEAWFGNFGHAEHFRKVVLASCREAERAKAVANETKISEARLDDLARTSDKYVQYLVDTLNGRHLREQNVLASMAR
jgi:hypothetical protein